MSKFSRRENSLAWGLARTLNPMTTPLDALASVTSLSFRKAELGAIHIGRNITDYKWDGTDMYGQALANGVYIY